MQARPGTDGKAPGRVLVAYATRFGSTRDVAEAVASSLRAARLEADVAPVKEVRGLEGYGAVVLGTAACRCTASRTRSGWRPPRRTAAGASAGSSWSSRLGSSGP